MTTLNNRKIILGITGGIAAYKSADLVRRLRELGAEVRVVMTTAAQNLITAQTFQALSGHEVLVEGNSQSSSFGMDHIDLARWANVIVVAPATAHFMAQVAHGFAGDLLTTLCLATEAPLLLAPAMNQQMWSNAATQSNRKILLERGIYTIGPNAGSQACGEVGPGRMAEPDEIVFKVIEFFAVKPLENLKIVITAGPTREPIDPVRYISNHSSGKMGYALAEQAARQGAQVILISGPTALPCPHNVQRFDISTAQEMADKVMEQLTDCAIFIGAAAVADYGPLNTSSQKIKKTEAAMQIHLRRNPDIIATVAALENPPFLVGFAAETENLLEAAKLKLTSKKLDMIAANWVGSGEGGFHSDQNELWVLSANNQQHFSMRSKSQLANDLLQLIIENFVFPAQAGIQGVLQKITSK